MNTDERWGFKMAITFLYTKVGASEAVRDVIPKMEAHLKADRRPSRPAGGK